MAQLFQAITMTLVFVSVFDSCDSSDGKRCEFFVASKEVTWAGWQPITPHSARRQCYQVAMTTRISRHRGDYEIKSLHSTTAETIVFWRHNGMAETQRTEKSA